MISDELISKFKSIQDLPVSEEFLAAYDEDKLDSYERLCIEAKIENNPIIEALISDSQDNAWETNLLQEEDTPFRLDEICLPDIPEIDETFSRLHTDIFNVNLGEALYNPMDEGINSRIDEFLLPKDMSVSENLLCDDDIFNSNDLSISSESFIEDDFIDTDISKIDL